MRRQSKQRIAFLLVFAMIFSLFGGYQAQKRAEAASGTISLGTLSWQDETTKEDYTFPDAMVSFDEDQTLFSITVTNGGSFTVPEFTLGTAKSITGLRKADRSGNKNEFVSEVQAGDDLIQMTYHGTINSAAVESFLQRLVFHRNGAESTVQHTITALANKAELEDDMGAIALDGVMHYYQYVRIPDNDKKFSWYDAYKAAKQSKYNGLEGYLATITKNVEQEYIYKFFNNKNNASKDSNNYLRAWIGGMRTKTDKIGTNWDVDEVNKDNINLGNRWDGSGADTWYWMCGPEAGKSFYKTTSLGTVNVGGERGCDIPFAAWNTAGAQEPNNNISGQEDPWQQEYALEYGFEAEGYWNDYSPFNVMRSEAGQYGIVGYLIEYSPYENDAAHGGTRQEESIPTINEEKVVTASDVNPNATPDTKGLISGKVVITNPDDKDVVKVGTVLKADVSGVNPYGSHDTLEYQWYVENEDGTLTEIPGANGQDYTVTDQTVDKDFVVRIKGTGHYRGEIDSKPYSKIYGEVVITNKDKDENGKDVVKVGTALKADISGVGPEDSHDTLTYQWYIRNEDGSLTKIPGAEYPNYVVTDQTIDKELVVIATGNENYYGNVDSKPYDTERTSVDIGLVDDPTDPDGKRSITIHPTDKDTIYAIKDDSGNVIYVPTVDGDKNPLEKDKVEGHPGYYQGTDGGTITFTDLDKDKTYIIHEIKITTDDNNKEVVGPKIPDSDIKTEYDDKGTKDKKDDKATIIVDPADPDKVYAILEKQPDGSYEEIPVSKDANGNYKADPDGTTYWSDGGENIVKFTELEPGGTYKVVAKPKDGDDKVADEAPGDVTGGSVDIKTPNKPEGGQTGVQPTKEPTPTAKPGTNFTKKEQDAATKFIKEHLTDPKKKIITTVTDLTRDTIVNGEADWKKLSAREKQAVNARLKQNGGKYTYEQLLKMAKAYKIPGFEVIKYMKKKTKAKIKLIKCKGATISCTTTNKKVATINKKGVIRAKKVGRARLTLTAVKGKYTSRLVINVRVKKKFKNAKEIKKLNSKAIKTPTALIAKQRRLGKSSKIKVYDLAKGSKVKYTPINKKVLKINKKGKYKGLKKGKTLVRTKVVQNNKIYWLYVSVTIY